MSPETPRPLRWLDTAPRHHVWLALAGLSLALYAVLGVIIWVLV